MSKQLSVEEWSKSADTVREIIEKDMRDGSYNLFSSTSRSLNISLSDNCLTFEGKDWGSICEEIWGRDEYEFYYYLDEEKTRALITVLRKNQGVEIDTETLLKNEFGCDDGSIRFREMCERNDISYRFISI